MPFGFQRMSSCSVTLDLQMESDNLCRDARITEIYEGTLPRFATFHPSCWIKDLPGTSEIQRLVIAQSVIKEIAGDPCTSLYSCPEERVCGVVLLTCIA